MERQHTATVYIVRDDKALLIYHRKLKKWLPPGGHLEGNELPPEGAVREAKEETGWDIRLFDDEHVWVDRWNARSFTRPYLCLLESIPSHGSQPAHEHIDFIYVGSPVSGQETLNEGETDGLRWFSMEEIDQLRPDVDIFLETQHVVKQILQNDRILQFVRHLQSSLA